MVLSRGGLTSAQGIAVWRRELLFRWEPDGAGEVMWVEERIADELLLKGGLHHEYSLWSTPALP